MPLKKVTYHTSSLNSFWYIACIWFTPKNVALKVLVSCVHNEGEGVDVFAHSHEGQEPHTTLHHDLLFILVTNQRLIMTTGYSVELSIFIKWEDTLVQYCNSFLSIINRACSGLGWTSPSRLSPENRGFEHYHKILKCCIRNCLFCEETKQHGYNDSKTCPPITGML